MSVIHQSPVYAVTAGEGDGPDAAALAANLGGTPAVPFGTAYASGTATTFLRTDDQIKFPNSLLTDTTAAEFTFSDDGLDYFIDISNPGGVLTDMTWRMQATTQFGLRFLPDSITSPTDTIVVGMNPGAGSRNGLRSSIAVAGSITSDIAAAWNANQVYGAAKYTTATLCGYRMQTLSASPTASSDTNNKMYGLLFSSPTIANANGGWIEVASAYFGGPKRTISNPTVTLGAGIIVEVPVISATDQIGVYVKTQTAQQAATNRYAIKSDAMTSGTNRWGAFFTGSTTGTPTNCYGLYSDSHGVGTNRWSYWGSNKFHCDASDFIANASGFGFSNRDSQSSSAGGGGTARYWRIYTDASATGVAGDVTINIDSLGVITATRAGGATGTVQLILKDVGTAPVTT